MRIIASVKLAGQLEQAHSQVFVKIIICKKNWCLDEYKNRKEKARTNGIQSQMQTLWHFFGLRLDVILLRYSDNLGTSLQAKYLRAAATRKISKKTVETLKKMRFDDNIELF